MYADRKQRESLKKTRRRFFPPFLLREKSLNELDECRNYAYHQSQGGENDIGLVRGLAIDQANDER
jgi:hypothetical protein